MIVKSSKFMHIRQRLGESVMHYMERYQQFLQFAGRVADTNRNLVHFFCEGLFPAIGGTVTQQSLRH
ncbi:hypothetical protein Scep_008685 [Stephania cephalantha]|uniref:Retrotransposon gag domain-containing protein n=1 Tax=Stephania cephalantha TaxID=152367 RepID=A0AAP0KDY0_9MAGN